MSAGTGLLGYGYGLAKNTRGLPVMIPNLGLVQRSKMSMDTRIGGVEWWYVAFELVMVVDEQNS